MSEPDDIKAQVIAVFPDKVKILVDDIASFSDSSGLKVGSYLKVTDTEHCALIAIIENFVIEVNDKSERKHIIEALPLGIISDGKFTRGGDNLTIPPTGVYPASKEDIRKIFEDSISAEKKFIFCSLAGDAGIRVPVDGNKFFDKHIAIVGSTGAGKSHTISRIIQSAVSEKNDVGDPNFGLNNSHVVIFDIHSEYKSAFPDCNHIDVNQIKLPYWLLNSEELEEVILDTGERDNYNQSSVFRDLVTENKIKHNPDLTEVFFDSPVKFNISEVLNAIFNIKNETINYKNSSRYMIVHDSYSCVGSSTTEADGLELSRADRLEMYFNSRLKFHPPKNQNVSNGIYADKTLEKFFARFEAKVAEKRLSFLFGNAANETSLEDVLKSLIGYSDDNNKNVTVVDLSGVPFEVLSITVSLISRILFEYGYHYKKIRSAVLEKNNNDAPILLVYEEAHKYVPKSDLLKFRSSRLSIERIAKEGRKYGVTLLLSSQRPSEISETIFSQCSSFVAMRLTNPIDQSYVSRLMPDTLGKLCDKLPSLAAGEALLIGESIVMPSLVKIDLCAQEPSSNDIPYFELWKNKWKDLDFDKIIQQWTK